MLSRFFIDRPIFSSVLSIVIALTGGLALLSLPIAQYPEITPPAVSVSISYPGASAQVVADTVAAPIEQQVNGVQGMLYMSSQSGNDGSYSLSVTFDVGTNLNTALVMVQNRVQLAMPQLPTAVQLQGITIRKRTPDILQVINFTSPDGRYDNIYLSNFATVYVRDELLRIEGVSDITVFGQRDYSIRVWLDPQKLAALNLTGLDVAAAVRAQNVEAAAGRVGQPPVGRGLSFQYPVDTLGRLTTPEQFGDIVVKAGQGMPAAALSELTASGGTRAGSGGTSGGGNTGGGATNTGATDLTQSSLGEVSNPLGTSGTTGSSSTNGGATGTGMTSSGSSGSTSGGSTAGDPSTAVAPFASTSNLVPQAATTPSSGGGGTSTATAGPTAGGAVGANEMAGGAMADQPFPSAGIVRLRDVARIELGAQSYNNGATFDGLPSVGLAVRQLPGTNALDAADAVRAKMEELKARFPDGVEYSIAYDTTPFIRESVQDVVRTLFEAVGLVAVVVLVFLQNWRAAVIPLVAVPVAILGTFAVMAGLGFTINNISLFGLVLAIGIVVDDAIVVVENVERWLEEGHPPKEAAYKAMEEVTGPVVAIALVLCAVFVPCAFVGGITGQFYRQFAVTITASTVFSAINSLTLSPALAAILMRKKEDGRDVVTRLLDLVLGWFFRLFNRGFDTATHAYSRVVGWLLRVSFVVLLLYGGLLFLTYWTFQKAPTGFVPDQDQGRVIVSIQLPDSASLQRTGDVIAQVDEIARKIPGVAHTTSAAGMSLLAGANSSNFGSVFLILDPFDRRRTPDRSSNAIIAKLRKAFNEQVREADVKVFGAPPVPGLSVASGFKIMVQDRGGLGLGPLQQQTDALVSKLQADPSLVGVLTQFRSKTPQLYLDLDRTKVESLGVPLNDVNQTMQIYLGSLYVNSFNEFGRHWQVTLQAEGPYRNDVPDVNLLAVRNKWNEMIPLGTLVKLKEINGPVSVTRYNMYVAAAISGSVPPQVSSGQAIKTVDAAAEQTLPRSMGTEWTELFFLQIRSGNTAIYVFFLAVVFVFLALAALYESWALPLAVILVVPLCLLCSVGGVLLVGKSVDIFVQIGLVVLVGLACKNAILIVEFAEVLHKQGKPRREAAVEASRLRLRPILMTSFAFVLGVLPLVVATGAGAEMRRSLGTAVFAGMLGVTVFGIFLTPVFFDLIQRFVDSKWSSAGVVRWGGSAAIGGFLGAAVGYLLAALGYDHMVKAVAGGAAVGAAAGLAIPAVWRRVWKR